MKKSQKNSMAMCIPAFILSLIVTPVFSQDSFSTSENVLPKGIEEESSSEDSDLNDKAPDGVSVGRKYDKEGDSVTQGVTRILDESGILGRQRSMAESIIIMDQQLRFNEKVQDLLIAFGPDKMIEVSPGVFESFSDTPAGMRARIELINLQKELAEVTMKAAEISNNTSAPNDNSTREGEALVVPDINPDPDQIRFPSRNDGTDFQALERQITSLTDEQEREDPADKILSLLEKAEQRLAEREAQIIENVAQAGRPLTSIDPVSKSGPEVKASSSDLVVREIYGSAGVFVAVLMSGQERFDVRVGDNVNGSIVSRIGKNFIELEKDGSSTRISF